MLWYVVLCYGQKKVYGGLGIDVRNPKMPSFSQIEQITKSYGHFIEMSLVYYGGHPVYYSGHLRFSASGKTDFLDIAWGSRKTKNWVRK